MSLSKRLKTYKPIRVGRSVFHKIRDVNHHFRVWGEENDPILFYLHGWADTGSTFQFVVDALKSNWRVIAPDLRGFGKSQHIRSNYWFPDYLADLDEMIQFFSADKPVTLIGHSMGANIASLYAGIAPEKVSHLINIEGFGLKESNPNNAPNNYRRWIEQQKQVPVFQSYSSFEELTPRILKRSPNMAPDRALFVAQEWTETTEELINLRVDPYHKLPNAVQYRRNEAEACWRKITASTLLIFGEKTNFKEEMQLLMSIDDENASFHDAVSECIPNVGHMIHFEAPEMLAQIIEEFLLNL